MELGASIVRLSSRFMSRIRRLTTLPPWSPSRLVFGASLFLTVLLAAVLVWDDVWRLNWAIGATSDWDRHLSYLEGAANSVLEHGEPPYWNPYPCGGVPRLAHPESNIYTPFYVFTLVMSPNQAVRWLIGAHHVIAVVGTWLLALSHLRRRGGTPLAAPLGACLFAACSVFPLHMAEGHFEWMPAAYVPWIVYFFERSLRSGRLHHAIYAGAGFGLMIGEGATYPTTHTAVFMAAYGGLLCLSERRWRPFFATTITLVSGVFLAGPKVVPMAEFLSRRPRHIGSPEELPLQGVFQTLTAHTPPPAPWWAWAWHEFGHYVGMLGLALAVFGALVGGKRARMLAIVALLFLVLGAGSFAPWAPWSLLHELPGFSSQHVPSRFIIGAILPLAVLAALGLGALLGPQSTSRRWMGCLVFTFMLLTDQWVVRHDIFHPIQCPPAEEPELPRPNDKFITLSTTPHNTDCRPLAAAARDHVAVIEAYEPLCPREDQGSYNGRQEGLLHKGDPAYRGEAWLEPDAGAVRLVKQTDNRFVFRIDANRPSVLTVNQNGDTGWAVNDPACGKPYIDEKKRLALRVPAGKRTIAIRYTPPRLGLGIGLAVATLLAFLVLRYQQLRKIPT
ncbi:MAG: hypothetical protein QM784_20790 [Polyangiaceae bacterium]